jgi:hypothetical protein
MGKSNSGGFSLSKRKTRKKSQAQCFSTLYYKKLNLEAAAVALRDEFIAENPAIAKKWRATPNSGFTVLRDEDLDDDDDEEEEEEEQGGRKKKATDPTAIVRFRQVAIKQAWAQASEEHKRATVAAWEKQNESSDDDGEDGDSDTFAKGKGKGSSKRAE